MKKIFFFIYNLGSGGAERIIVELANYFCNVGHGTTIITVDSLNRYEELLNKDVHLICLNKNRALGSIFNLACIMQKNKDSIFCSFLPHTNLAAILAKLICFSNINLTISERGIIEPPATIREKTIILAMKVLYNANVKIIGISKKCSLSISNVLHIKTSRIKTIYNPILSNNISSEDRIEREVISKIKQYQGRVIISIGRLMPVKNHELMIDAFRMINSTQPALLLLLGEGEEKNKLQTKIKSFGLEDRILFLGFQKNTRKFLLVSDVFVLHSHSESFGNVLTEAMQSSIHIVSTDCGGPTEILENGKWGKIVENGNPRALSLAIEQSLNDPKRKIDYTERLKELSISRIADEYLKVFNL